MRAGLVAMFVLGVAGVALLGGCRGDAPACDDHQQNGLETGLDCGGPCETACADGDGCAEASDCASGVCTGGVCQAASCVDLLRNGTETDVDCGGTCPMGCGLAQACSVASDCASGFCSAGVCQDPDDRCAIFGQPPIAVVAASMLAPYRFIDTPIGSHYVTLLSLTSPVRLESLAFDVSSMVSEAEVELLDGCAGVTLATGTQHNASYPGIMLISYYWTDGAAPDLAPGTYIINVLSADHSPAPVTVVVRGAIAVGEACTDPLVAAGVLACGPTSNCIGGRCELAACSNGIDDDGDGLTDVGDPGCATDRDDDEGDGCAAGACPACANSTDDDGDGAVDWPGDHGCRRLGDLDEHNCPDINGVVEVGGGGIFPLAGGLPVQRRCGRFVFDGPERLFHVRLEDAGHAIGFHALPGPEIALYRDACDTEAVTCVFLTPQGPETVHDLPAGDYYIAAFGTTDLAISVHP